MSPVQGPSGLQEPPCRDPSPESRCSRKRSRYISPSSSSASASASSPSSPPKKKKHSRKSDDISKIPAQLSSMRSDYATTMRSVQSRLAALESPAPAPATTIRREVTEEQEDEDEPDRPDDCSCGDEAVSPDPHPLDYDPHHPSLDYSPSRDDLSTTSLAPSLTSDTQPEQEDPQKEFFFFPEETGFNDDAIQYRGYFISYDSGDVECSKIQGQEAFSPIKLTPAVRFLLNRSERVRPVPEASCSNRQNFRSLTKPCNTYAYRSLNFVPGPAYSHTITTGKPPTFLATIPNLEPITPSAFTKTPLFVDLATNSDPYLDIYAFANAPLLPKDCHKLGGLLANLTSAVPDYLHSKDFEARQTLAGLLFTLFRVRASLRVKELVTGLSRQTEDHLSTMGRFLSHGALPSLEALITNAAANARQVRAELREKATAKIKTTSVRSSLRKGSLFSTSLFHTDAVKKAEDCCKMPPPPPITVYATPSAPPHCQPTKQKTNHPAKFQANPTRQSFQSKGNARSTSTRDVPIHRHRLISVSFYHIGICLMKIEPI